MRTPKRTVIACALAVALLCLVLVSPAAAGQPEEHCEQPYLSYLLCITAGLAWVIPGTEGDDRLIGYLFDDIIRSGKGADLVNGKKGYDVCYVQPQDIVKNCEELRP